jgi:flagellar motor component MotA
MIEGIKSIQSGDNPRIVEQKLIAFIEPKKRQEASIEALTTYAESRKHTRG